MKPFILSTLVILVASAILQMFLPWWVIAIIAFITGCLFRQKSGNAFLAGFISIFVLWISFAFYLSNANDNLLAHKIALLFPLGSHVSLLLLITGIIGGLVGGLATLSGSLARKAIA